MRTLINYLVLPVITISMLQNVAIAGDCEDAMSQVEMTACADQDYQKADAELNKVYKELQKQYKGEALFLANLKKAQQAWIKFKDAEVDAHFPLAPDADAYVEYGTMYPMSVSLLLTTLTQGRTKQLKELLENGYGN